MLEMILLATIYSVLVLVASDDGEYSHAYYDYDYDVIWVEA